MTIELRHLRYAVAAAHHGSFGRAATALGVEQSSLSRRIRQMEDRLGVIVFERSSSGVRLTAAGAEILRTSRHLVEGVDHMVLSAKASRNVETDRLAIGFYTSLSAGNLRSVLMEFARRYPEIELLMVEAERERLLIALDHGLMDVVIVTGENAGLEGNAKSLWSERISVALPRSHPLAANEIVYWTDLRGQCLVLSQRDPGPEFRELVLAKLPTRGVRPRIVSRDVGQDGILSLVGAGFGLSLTCEAALGLLHADVVYRDLQDSAGPSVINYGVCWQRGAESTASHSALAQFLELLNERYPSLPAMTVNPGGPLRTPDRSP